MKPGALIDWLGTICLLLNRCEPDPDFYAVLCGGQIVPVHKAMLKVIS